jgi:RNase P/RNase MRP subunit p30
MRFFDIVALKEEINLERLAERFGYGRVFLAGRDVEVVGDVRRIGENGRFIVRSGDRETLSKAVRAGSVIGVIVEGEKPDGKFVEELRTHEKILFVPVAPLVCPSQGSRMRGLYAAKSAVRTALKGKARVALVTLAEGRECLLSSRQMLEIAKLLGAGDRAAGEMLSAVGDSL